MSKPKKEEPLAIRLLNQELKLFNRTILLKYLELPKFPIPKAKFRLVHHKTGVYYGVVDLNDNPNGLGAFVYNDGSIFEGHYIQGIRTGPCVWVKANGEVLDGVWESDLIVNGTFKCDGFTYEGSFTNEMPDGIGKETYPSGNSYQGMFNRGVKTEESQGVYNFANGDKYQGHFSGLQYNGPGVFTWNSASEYDCYDGEFARNKRDGYGVFRWKDGDVVSGTWKNDNLHGQAELIYEGVTHKIEWVDGESIGLNKVDLDFPKTKEPDFSQTFRYRTTERVLKAIPTEDAPELALKIIGYSKNDAAVGIISALIKNEPQKPPALTPNLPLTDPNPSNQPLNPINESIRNPVEELKSDGFFSRITKAAPAYRQSIKMKKQMDDSDSVSLTSDEDEIEVHDDDKVHAISLPKEGRFPIGNLKFRRDYQPASSVISLMSPTHAALRKDRMIMQNLQLRHGMLEADKLASLGNIYHVIKLISVHVINPKVIEIRQKLGCFDYSEPVLTVGFAEWQCLPDESYYKGEWSTDRLRSGRGVHLINGELYEGMWQNDMKEGLGRHINAFGDFFLGYWQNDIRSGFGVLRREEGYEYIGDWQDNIPHGQGIENTPKGSYEGTFTRGIHNGKGQLRLLDGTTFKGEFVNGKISGYGVMTQMGKSYAGIWTDNELVGRQIKVTADMHLNVKNDKISPEGLFEYMQQPFPKFVLDLQELGSM